MLLLSGVSVRSSFFKVLFKSSLALLVFYLVGLSIVERGILKFLTIIELFFLSI